MAAVDVAVIGGGIAGVSVAAFLAEGGLRVRLYERDAIAAGASGRNSGIVQHPFDPIMADLYGRSIAEYRKLADATGGAFALGDEPAGLLLVGREIAAAKVAARDWAGAWPVTRPDVVVGADLRALEPALAPDLVACRLTIGFPVTPGAATEAFAAVARRAGVDVVVGGGVARPVVVDGHVTGVERNGSVEPAGEVVVAAGPWTPDVVEPAGTWRPIRSSWGVVASVVLPNAPRHGLEAIDITVEPHADAAPESASRQVHDDEVEFSLVPAAGSSALGSTFLPNEPDPEMWVASLRSVGSRYVPAVAAAPLVGLRRCARPVSRDGRPLVGRAPWVDGLWILAGHGPWGISTAPGSARLVADAILGRGPDDAIPAALAAARFGWPR